VLTVSPLSGRVLETPFTLSFSGLSGNYTINWGDGTITNQDTATHYYTAANVYNIFFTDCETSSSLAVSAYPGVFFQDSIVVNYDTDNNYTGCLQTFNLAISSRKPTANIVLYASGSNAHPATDDQTFWKHLTPEWCYYDINGDKISELNVSCSPVYSGDILLGYSALSSVYYKDDMPGTPNLFFTIKQAEESVLINTRAYAAFPFTVSAIIPNKIKISRDGIDVLDKLQWADQLVPYVTTVINDTISCSNMIHYVSGYLSEVKYVTECYGVDNAYYQSFLSEINPYAIQNFLLPTSALPADTLIYSDIPCGQNPHTGAVQRIRNVPVNVAISATGLFNVEGVIYALTGISDTFNIYPFENFHKFYRKGEDKTVYDLINKYSHINNEQSPTFNNYLSAIAGEGDSLGRVYDKIQNFTLDHFDIDTCNIESIHNIANKLGTDIDDFGLQFPEELKRMMHFFSIPFQKLVGSRCKCNTFFSECQNVCGVNTCTLCGYDKRTNLGRKLTSQDNLSAGTTILYREHGSDVYNFLPVKPQIDTIYPLHTLTAQPILNKGLNSFCFFEWDQTPQNFPVEGIINYKDTRNNLSPFLSSYSDWYDDGGIVEETLNYILTKNLFSE